MQRRGAMLLNCCKNFVWARFKREIEREFVCVCVLKRMFIRFPFKCFTIWGKYSVDILITEAMYVAKAMFEVP